MHKSLYVKKRIIRRHNRYAPFFRDFILGGQDGLVNDLGIILGLSAGTGNSKIVIIAGLTAMFVQSISMGVVGYTSTKAEIDYCRSQRIKLSDELSSPFKGAIIVSISSLIGSLIPLLPFFFFSIQNALIFSIILSAVALFIAGAIEAKFTIGNWISKGIQLMVIGMTAALIGFIVGKITGYSGWKT